MMIYILKFLDDVLNASIITITEQEIQHRTVDRFKYNLIQINVGIK